MPRIRTVKPEAFAHPEMVRVSIPARLLLISLWTQADDDGRLYEQIARIRGYAFGDADRVNLPRLLDELANEGRIHRYEDDGRRCICIPNLRRHQRIDRPTPSTIPLCPLCEDSTSDQGTLYEPSTLEGKGKEGKGTGKSAIAEAFEEFWKASPRREGKIAARAAFEKSAKLGAEPRLMVSAMRLYAEQMQREGRDRSKIKLPTTWLNAGCWEDDYGDPRKPTREEIAAEIAALGAEVEP